MMNNALALIPSTDTAAFAGLPDAVKGEVQFWLRLMGRLDGARALSAEFEALAREFGGARALSAANIRTKYYAYRKSGWKALVNKAKLPRHNTLAPAAPTRQPAAFIEFWKALQESSQRNSRAAYRDLVRRYRAGEQIPGIGNWRTVWRERVGTPPPETCPVHAPLPQGWSERNLARFRPTNFELTATRIGRGAAAKFRPLVYTTRAGMACGQVYVFDDVWHDNKVNWVGVNRQAMRPLEFSCLDLFSGCQVAWGAQPMLENEATGKRETLRETEMRFLLCHVLCSLGWHPAGCRLHVEHGTAAVREELAELLFHWTGGAVQVARGGIHGEAAHDGFFMGRGKGNSRFKAALESHHNLKHNELAMLAGQVGKDRDHSPEELHGRDTYNNTLIKAMSQLPAHRAELLQLPYLDFTQWRQIVGEVYERINGRIDHRLEGWEEAGLIVTEYRLGEGAAWEPMTRLLDLPPERRAAVETLIDQPGMVRSRKLSPAEVWHIGRRELVRLAPHHVPLILGHRNAKQLRVGPNQLIEFQDRRIGPGTLRFFAEAETERGERVPLEQGATYSIYATPFDTSAVFVAGADNEFIGIARAVQTPCKTDIEAIHRQIGRSMKQENELLAPVRARHAAEARAKARMHEHNASVLRGEPVTPDELFRTKRMKEEFNEADMAAVLSRPQRADEEEEFTNEEISILFSKP